ncbi:hypothetical protein [Amycolatopsis lexingtonensis]|uniref:hypothetical protein n=1 Tax=Amycolatopsis lexingtonensis TaxID=218822 RepID=UPI003F6FC939
MLTRRSWRWFTARLTGLSAQALTRLSLATASQDQPEDDVDDLDRDLGVRRR